MPPRFPLDGVPPYEEADDDAERQDEGLEAEDGDESGPDDGLRGVDDVPVEQASDAETEGQERQVEPPRRKKFPSERVRQAVNAKNEAERRNAALEAQLQLMQEERQRQIQLEQAKSEAERLQYMSFEERTEYRLNKAAEANEVRIRQIQFENAVAQDRALYETKASVDAHRKQLASEVERVFQDELKRGRVTDRETIYVYLVGQEELARRAGSVSKRREATAREEVRAPNTRGTAPRTAPSVRADAARTLAPEEFRKLPLKEREKLLEGARIPLGGRR